MKNGRLQTRADVCRGEYGPGIPTFRDLLAELVASVCSIDGRLARLKASPDGTEPELLTAEQAAQLCGCGARTFRTYSQAQLVPRPVRIGEGCVRWRRRELLDWIAAGAPNCENWEWEGGRSYKPF